MSRPVRNIVLKAGWRLVLTACAFVLLGATSEAADWPTNSNCRSEGPFRAWSSIPDDPLLQLDKLKGVSEVSQVLVHGGGWVVLRPDGTTVSNIPSAEREGIAKMFPGFDRWFALVTHSGELIAFNAGGLVDPSSPPESLTGRKVVDCFLAPTWGSAIDSDGELHVWGKEFDGVRKPGNGEWPETPAMPEGVRATALSGCAPGLSVMGDDGVLRSWSFTLGSLNIPVNLVEGGVTDFAHGAHFIARLSDNSDPVMHWHYRDGKGTGTKINSDFDPMEIFTAGEGIVLRSAAGELEFAGALRQNSGELGGIASLIRASSSDAVSVFRRNRAEGNWDAQVLWFDDEVTPVVSNSETLLKVPEVTEMPEAVSEPSSLVSIPDTVAFRTRLGAYQKARQKRLLAITGTYATALKNAEIRAKANGDLDPLVRIREGVTHAKQLQLHLDLISGSQGIAPVALPPPLSPPVELSLEEARGQFEADFIAAERELAKALDQSLNFVQQNQVKNRKIASAKETRELREELAQRFADAFPSGSEATAMAATKSPTTPTASASSSRPALKPDTKPGRLEVWSSSSDDDAMRITRGRGFDDFIQVRIYKDGWVALRENGDVVGSNRDHDRTGIVRLTKGWDNAFGMIQEDGELIYFGPAKGKPPTRIRSVRDAFVCETHSIALHEDGTITTWGPAYTEGDLDGQKWLPAPTGLAGIDRVLGSPWLGIAITSDGMTTAWRATGPCRMGRGTTVNVRDISVKGESIRFVNENGGMLWWRMSDSGANGYPDWKERYGELKSLPETQEANFARLKDGSIMTDLKWIERDPELREALEANKGAPEEAFSYWTGAGPHRFAWIEPR